MKKNLLLHPFLIAIYPVFYLYSENMRQLSVSVVVVPMAILSVLALILLVVGSRLFRNSHKAAFSVSVFLVWLFSYSAVRSMMTFEIAGLQLYRHRYFILIWTLVLVVAVLLVVKAHLDFARVTKALNSFAVLLMLLPLWTILTYRNNHGTPARPQPSLEKKEVARLTTRNDSLPSVYYIILDAYTGQKGLKKHLGFDNSAFVQFLRSKGFFVAEESHSNYAWTSLSLASSLNMNYLPAIPTDGGSDTLEVDKAISEFDLILDSKVRVFLQSLGYEFVDLSIWSTRAFVSPKDYAYQYFTAEFSLSLLRMTFLNRPLVENYVLGRIKRERAVRRFDELRRTVNLPGPLFVYAHLLIPHHPYVFDSTGNMPPPHQSIAELGSEKEMYLSQLLYANKEMEKTVDVILSKSKIPPIVVIQGDHGAYQLAGSQAGNARLRMSILNAYYVPDKARSLLYDTVTPVNTFRIIFDGSFGTHFGLLQDKSFFSTMENYRRLIHITPQLREQ